MKLKKTVWKTGDDCWNCGSPRVIFLADDSGNDQTNDHHGYLLCLCCGDGARSVAYDYQVPQEART